MKELKELFSCLSKADYLVLKSQYELTLSPQSKKIQLLNLLYHKKVQKEEDACFLLYQKKSSSAFIHLKSNLKEDISRFILIHHPPSGQITSSEEAEIECSICILIAKSLINAGVYGVAYRQLEQAEKLADKYELILQKIQIASMLGRRKNANHNLSIHKKYNAVIYENIELLKSEVDARDHFLSITMPHVYEKNKESKYSEEAFQHLKKIKGQSETIDSSNIKYYYYKSCINYLLITQEYEQALKKANECLDLILKNPALNSATRLSAIYCQFAQIFMELKQVSRAHSYILKATENINKDHVGYLVCLLIRFVTELEKEDFEQAAKTINEAEKHKISSSNPYYFYNVIYYKAVLCFKRGELPQAWKLINKYSKLQKDSTGWLLGFKLIELMTLIELKEEQIIPLRLDAFKQLILRQPRLKSGRYKHILDLLRKLRSEDYDFTAVVKENKELLTDLRNAKGDLYRDPLAFELIAFEDWIEKQAKRSTLQPGRAK